MLSLGCKMAGAYRSRIWHYQVPIIHSFIENVLEGRSIVMSNENVSELFLISYLVGL